MPPRRPFPRSGWKRRRPMSRPRRGWSIACSAGPAGWSPASRSRCRCFTSTPAGAWPFTDFPIITTQPLRYAHVAFVLMLSFLLFPLSERFRNRIRWWDIAAGIMGAAILVYAIEGGEEFTDRATMPTHLDVVLGVIFIVLLLEATRR